MKKTILMAAYANYITDARLLKEAECAVENGYEVDFISLRKEGERKNEIVDGVKLYRLKQSRYRGNSQLRYIISYFVFMIKCFFKISYLYFKNKYHIVHINNMPDFIVFSAILPKIFGAKIILDIHDPMPNLFLAKTKSENKSFKYKFLVWQECISARFSHLVITVTEQVKDTLTDYGIERKKIRVLTNFADDKIFKLNHNYSINSKLKLIFHGTIAERYGLKNILIAISRLKNKENVEFKIIGEGDFSDELKKIIRDLDLDNVVKFDNKMYKLNDVVKLIKGYNLGIVSSEFASISDYGLPVKLLEYISLGIPALLIKSKAVDYYLQGKGYFYYNPDDIDSIINVLDQVICNHHILYSKRDELLTIRNSCTWSSEKIKYINALNSM